MTDQQGQDDAFAADMLLIEELVDELGLDRWPGDSETILEVGNLEDTRVLAIRHGLFTFETTSRGVRSTAAAFNSARDARRFLIMDLGESLRFRTRMAPIVMQEPADGSELEEVPTGHRLSWPGAEATFYRRYEAVTFSWVIDADPATIAASYRHINGEPLCDLGIRAETELVERPRGRALDPPPRTEHDEPGERGRPAARSVIRSGDGVGRGKADGADGQDDELFAALGDGRLRREALARRMAGIATGLRNRAVVVGAHRRPSIGV